MNEELELQKAKNQFGRFLKKNRKQLKLKQKELALKLGISVVSLSRLENGSLTPSFKTLMRIGKVLDKDIIQIDDQPDTDNGLASRAQIKSELDPLLDKLDAQQLQAVKVIVSSLARSKDLTPDS
ncbi:MAG: helix-turn-helix transcriptional regulator [Magnetococcales bacterium]|nr:helix-turn-helix transcriptional regulator [Magnetococcales bacterium]